MEIKTKKTMKLPQLIEWGFENDIKKATYMSENGLTVDFSFDGKAVVGYAFGKDDLFTVEVDEEITEDTEFEKLICLGVDDEYESYDNLCILDFDEDRVRAIYIPNDDLTMTLIWRDGKLVE